MSEVNKFGVRGLRSAFLTKIATGLLSLVALTAGMAMPAAARQFSIWSPLAAPGNVSDPDTNSVELGVKFRSDVGGVVTGVRFYKSTENTGTHVGHLWRGDGTLLGTVTFSNETDSGWQQANFSGPIAIQANTIYVISYYCPNGHYAGDAYTFNSSVDNGPLHAIQDSSTAPNGVYSYGNSFPQQSWHATNYWVDVAFRAFRRSTAPTETAPPATTGSPAAGTHSISGHVSGAMATLTLSGPTGAQTTTDSAGNFAFTGLADGSYVIAASQSGYSFSPSPASASVNGGDVTGVNFTATTAQAAAQRTVTLNWTSSTSSDIAGYKVYRATSTGGPYVEVTGSLVTGTSFVDNTVTPGETYYYVTSAVDSDNEESGYSNEAVAVVRD